MDTVITLTPTFDDALNANILIKKIIKIDDEQITKNWRCTLAKGTDLTGMVFATSFGQVAFDDFPAEKAYILAKWAEI